MIGRFITGTDTGVGKTHVTAALARRGRARGRRVFAFKPIETGCQRHDERLVGSDQELVSEAAGGWQTGPLRGVYQFEAAVAPLVAAELSKTHIDLDLVVTTAQRGAEQADLTVVEGVGGWRVPITATVDVASLALRLSYPVIVVARAGLGTINHSLLTLEAIERDGARVAGLVLSLRPTEDLRLAESNLDEIARRWDGQIVLFGDDPAALDALI